MSARPIPSLWETWLSSLQAYELYANTAPRTAFTYEGLSPDEIKFAPLNQPGKEMTGAELMTFYESDRHLGKYLHIIKDKPVYPYILDGKRRVCSMPP